jgi:PadR family transcriptional regulator PadR
MEHNTFVENTLQELRRGVIVLAVLNQVRNEEYGYSIQKSLSEKGLDVDQGTLYPLLRRLEGQGLLQSNWRVESDRPRRYYVLNTEGEKVLSSLKTEWKNMVDTINRLI